MKKILLSIGMIVFVAAAAAGATGAFFSDSETSTGNVLAAGAIDLGIDNTSYYNGQANEGTTWSLDYDVDDETPRVFFNFNDLKPGDYGEDTISLHVTDNAAWLCADISLTENDDKSCNEPEIDAEGAGCSGEPDADLADGELAGELDFMYWADDGDNVLESNEVPTITSGIFGATTVGATTTLSLVDKTHNVFSPNAVGTALEPSAMPVYVGKAWCFGTIAAAALTQDNATTTRNPSLDNTGNGKAGEPADGGYTCTGASGITNASQTDTIKATVSFRAEQARHNGDFLCVPETTPEPTTGTLTITKVVDSTGDEGTAPGVTDFAFEVDNGSSTAFEADGSNDIVLGAGAHSVVETTPANPDYVPSYQNSLNGEPTCDNLIVPAGGNVTCTITNTFTPNPANG